MLKKVPAVVAWVAIAAAADGILVLKKVLAVMALVTAAAVADGALVLLHVPAVVTIVAAAAAAGRGCLGAGALKPGTKRGALGLGCCP